MWGGGGHFKRNLQKVSDFSDLFPYTLCRKNTLPVLSQTALLPVVLANLKLSL